MEQTISAPLLPEARILLVDDEPHVLLALGRGLRLKGYNYVDEARSGQEALDKLTRLPYDLMMLDIRMPGMDGLEVLQKAQALRPNLLVVILTGHAALDSAVAALKSGMVVDYLLKPASLEQVDSAIHKALRKRVAEIQQRHSLEAAIAALEQLKSDGPVPQSKPAALPAERFQYAGPFSLDREKR
ncbi:MAG TPA: response regulator, partial [Anaerolineales bacterium]|nr:response regulator [Anaerolineales bacterium]